MSARSFSVPVTIIKGLGIPTTVWTVAEAYDILNEWPVDRRNGAYSLAKNACRAALSGDIDLDLAEEAFRGFARRNHILIENPLVGAAANPRTLVEMGAR